MTDDQFLASLADGSLPPSQFGHLGHIRLGWICLQRHGAGPATELACATIAAYASHLGAADKFHRTMTEAMMRLLAAAGAGDRSLAWPQFAASIAELTQDARGVLARHYSPGLLAAEHARASFAAPDRAPLPA